jgi:hypothetical protein
VAGGLRNTHFSRALVGLLTGSLGLDLQDSKPQREYQGKMPDLPDRGHRPSLTLQDEMCKRKTPHILSIVLGKFQLQPQTMPVTYLLNKKLASAMVVLRCQTPRKVTVPKAALEAENAGTAGSAS